MRLNNWPRILLLRKGSCFNHPEDVVEVETQVTESNAWMSEWMDKTGEEGTNCRENQETAGQNYSVQKTSKKKVYNFKEWVHNLLFLSSGKDWVE